MITATWSCCGKCLLTMLRKWLLDNASERVHQVKSGTVQW